MGLQAPDHLFEDDSKDIGFGAMAFVAFTVVVLLLVFNDLLTKHEVQEIPDCEESEVLDYSVYDPDVSKREFVCVEPDEL